MIKDSWSSANARFYKLQQRQVAVSLSPEIPLRIKERKYRLNWLTGWAVASVGSNGGPRFEPNPHEGRVIGSRIRRRLRRTKGLFESAFKGPTGHLDPSCSNRRQFSSHFLARAFKPRKKRRPLNLRGKIICASWISLSMIILIINSNTRYAII